jgi:hypothetical protein
MLIGAEPGDVLEPVRVVAERLPEVTDALQMIRRISTS